MNRFVALASLALLGVLPPPASAQAFKNSLDADEAAAVDRAVAAEMEKQEIVGAAVGLLHDGEIVYLKGYGLADLKKRTPVTTETVFNWASNSKPLCAVAAMPRSTFRTRSSIQAAAGPASIRRSKVQSGTFLTRTACGPKSSAWPVAAISATSSWASGSPRRTHATA